jgi:hypothetical protein
MIQLKDEDIEYTYKIWKTYFNDATLDIKWDIDNIDQLLYICGILTALFELVILKNKTHNI